MWSLLLPGLTVFESAKARPGDKRKRQRNNDAGDIDGYLGPWGKFVDEKTVMKPSEVVIFTVNSICLCYGWHFGCQLQPHCILYL